MTMRNHTDTVDVVEAVRVVRHGWRWILGAVAAGTLLAVLVVLLVPPRFDGAASIVVRESGAGGSSILSQLAGGSAISGVLGVGGGSLETEIEVLRSREMLGRVADSLLLQVTVVGPRRLPARAVVSDVRFPGRFEPVRYRFTRDGASYRVRDDSLVAVAVPGQPVRLGVGTLTLSTAEGLPEEFDLRIVDRDDAITRMQRRVSVAAPGGEVIQASFGARDSATAADVPNALIGEYLAWRRGTDRGVNRHRVEFLAAQSDTIAAQLAAAEGALRAFQERSGVLEPQVVGKIQLERAGELRAQVGALEVEQTALDQLLTQVEQGGMTARQLAAYPSFLRSPAINELINQIATLETERTALLERRLESDRSVVTIDRSIRNLESQLVPLATAYRTSLARQGGEMRSQLDALNARLAAMPAAGEQATRLQRDVLRLSQIHTAVQAQLVEARLAAVGEGGDIRQLDVAQPPKLPAFPKPATTLAAGVGGGLVVGVVLALIAGLLGPWIQDPRAIERTAGVPALRLDAASPLLVAGTPATPTILVVPIEEGTRTDGVAQRLARTAMARGTAATVLDLSGDVLPAGVASESVGARVERLERENGMVIVQLPGLAHDMTVATMDGRRPVLLVASAVRVERQRLLAAVETLRRLDVPCAGVVLNRTTDALTVA